MKKKILVSLIVLAIVAAMVLAFSGAQFEKQTISYNNLLTFGNITATEWSPDPMISLTNLVPDQTVTATCYLKPHGTINQDIWIGLENNAGYPTPDAGFGDQVEVALQVDGNWLWGGAYKDVGDLFAAWQKVKNNAAPDVWITINLQLHVKNSLPSSFMGVTYYFRTIIDAVQLGGGAPATVPWQITL